MVLGLIAKVAGAFGKKALEESAKKGGKAFLGEAAKGIGKKALGTLGAPRKAAKEGQGQRASLARTPTTIADPLGAVKKKRLKKKLKGF